MEHAVVAERDPATGHFTATVPGMPGIVVDARSERTVVQMAKKAIGMYLETHAPVLEAKVVSVDV